MRRKVFGALCAALTFSPLLMGVAAQATPARRHNHPKAVAPAHIDRAVASAMQAHKIPGLALAVIQDGRVVFVKAYGLRDREQALPLHANTVMYGASLTKAVFAYTVMQLVEEGVVDLDRPIAADLKKPLPDYPKYADLASDPRWKKITPRMVLDHTTGFPNFAFVNPDGKLDIKFEPGARYAYSGEGMNLLQFMIEEKTGKSLGDIIKTRVFDRFGMVRTSMSWRDDFAGDLTTGYDTAGKAEAHHKRGSVRAAGSMDTTVEDYAAFLAGFQRGEGLSAKSKHEMLRPQIAITSARQFPTLMTETDPRNAKVHLAAGLGWVLFAGRQGRGYFKAGHDDVTDNFALCLERRRRCVLILTNSGAASPAFPQIVRAVMGETGAPLYWEGQEP